MGIGTVSPGAKLGVVAPADQTVLRLQAASGSQTQDILKIKNSAGTDLLTVNNAGYLGIGDDTPDVALDVVGDINFTGEIVDVSDHRLKTNIVPVPDALAKITALQGVSFTMRDDPDGTTEFGLIAQDVEPVFPFKSDLSRPGSTPRVWMEDTRRSDAPPSNPPDRRGLSRPALFRAFGPHRRLQHRRFGRQQATACCRRRDALSMCLTRFARDTPATATQLIGLMAKEWESKRTLLLQGPSTPLSPPRKGAKKFSNVLLYNHFLTLLDPKRLTAASIPAHGNPDYDPLGRSWIAQLNHWVGRPEVFDTPPKALGGETVLWLAPVAIGAPLPSGPDRVRDLLGLVHHGERKPLMMVELPTSSVATAKCARPTFGDAGAHRRFRVKPHRRLPRGYGCTVDLGLTRSRAVHQPVDGSEELVTEPRPFSAALGVRWCYLGCTRWRGERDPKGARTDDDWDALFAERLRRGRPVAELYSRLARWCR